LPYEQQAATNISTCFCAIVQIVGPFLLLSAALLEVCQCEDAGKVVRVKMCGCVHVCGEYGWMHSCMCFPTCLLHADACTHGGSARMVDARTVLVALFNMYIVVYNEWM